MRVLHGLQRHELSLPNYNALRSRHGRGGFAPAAHVLETSGEIPISDESAGRQCGVDQRHELHEESRVPPTRMIVLAAEFISAFFLIYPYVWAKRFGESQCCMIIRWSPAADQNLNTSNVTHVTCT